MQERKRDTIKKMNMCLMYFERLRIHTAIDPFILPLCLFSDMHVYLCVRVCILKAYTYALYISKHFIITKKPGTIPRWRFAEIVRHVVFTVYSNSISGHSCDDKIHNKRYLSCANKCLNIRFV